MRAMGRVGFEPASLNYEVVDPERKPCSYRLKPSGWIGPCQTPSSPVPNVDNARPQKFTR